MLRRHGSRTRRTRTPRRYLAPGLAAYQRDVLEAYATTRLN
nr:hypothetical protein OG296_36185 [Streptomyces sp. NBC_01001]